MSYEEFYKKLGKRIKFLREEKHLTQEKLAEITGISLDYLGKIEVNINRPGLITLLKLAKALDISMEEFFKTL
ncbi:MAG: helix-turn-helix domain-containing protein [Candidatus Gastranaerophilales bacterium]|nr:helix-turn-helix domain-containing protein [Candidatus Gastranaerophilales bacterium]